jgi:cation transport ATPase
VHGQRQHDVATSGACSVTAHACHPPLLQHQPCRQAPELRLNSAAPARRYHSVTNALNFAVAVIVAAIPLALEIVVTSTLALGSRKLAQEGAIVTRLAAIEDLSGMNILCSDKTGAPCSCFCFSITCSAKARS